MIAKIVPLAIGGNSHGIIIKLRRNLERKKRRLKYDAMPKPIVNWKKSDATRKIAVLVRASRVTGSFISTM
jgi:hypothetical protein